MKKVGVVRLERPGREERCAENALTAGVFWLRIASCASPKAVGSQVCTDWRKLAIAPVFGQPCGRERLVQVGPGDRRDDRLERDTLHRSAKTAPPPSEMPMAPICVSETSGSRREPPEGLPQVGHLARPVERDEPARRAVAARVVGENGVALVDQEALRDRRHARARAAEAVEEHDRGPAAGGRRPVREVERRGERHAVVHRAARLRCSRRERERRRWPRRADQRKQAEEPAQTADEG